jgi:hypothetical protein
VAPDEIPDPDQVESLALIVGPVSIEGFEHPKIVAFVGAGPAAMLSFSIPEAS